MTASDSPSNVTAKALSNSLEGEWFLVDNAVPRITELRAQGGTATWTATDDASILQKAEYSINGGDWTIVEPLTRLHDAKQHKYSLTVPRTAGQEMVIAVRSTDYADNVAVAKVLLP